MLAVVHAVVREKKNGASCMSVWDVLPVLLGRIWVAFALFDSCFHNFLFILIQSSTFSFIYGVMVVAMLGV